jgi:hypothetical protein
VVEVDNNIIMVHVLEDQVVVEVLVEQILDQLILEVVEVVVMVH